MRLVKSFRHALVGIVAASKTEPNFRLHVIALLLVIGLGLFLQISALEWVLVLIVSGLVLALELCNTVLEKLLDLLKPRFIEQSGTIKDMAAGAVLIGAVTAFLVAIIIFIPRLIERF